MWHRLFWLCFVLICHATSASAIVVEMRVTPESVQAAESRMQVAAEQRADGRWRFAVTLQGKERRYLVVRMSIGDAEGTIAECDVPGVWYGDAVTYEVGVSPKYLERATLEVSERSLSKSAEQVVPIPGGIDYLIELAKFAKPKALLPAKP